MAHATGSLPSCAVASNLYSPSAEDISKKHRRAIVEFPDDRTPRPPRWTRPLILSYKRVMAVSTKFFRIALTVVLLCALALAADFTWDWHNQQVIGREDPSVANTSKLKEADRTALIDAIAARLQKPMSDHGYSDDRIREVASITRIRIADSGR